MSQFIKGTQSSLSVPVHSQLTQTRLPTQTQSSLSVPVHLQLTQTRTPTYSTIPLTRPNTLPGSYVQSTVPSGHVQSTVPSGHIQSTINTLPQMMHKQNKMTDYTRTKPFECAHPYYAAPEWSTYSHGLNVCGKCKHRCHDGHTMVTKYGYSKIIYDESAFTGQWCPHQLINPFVIFYKCEYHVLILKVNHDGSRIPLYDSGWAQTNSSGGETFDKSVFSDDVTDDIVEVVLETRKLPEPNSEPSMTTYRAAYPQIPNGEPHAHDVPEVLH